MGDRSASLGNRIKGIKQKAGFFDLFWRIDWSKGVYEPEFSDEALGAIKSLKHCPSGSCIIMDPHCGINKGWALIQNWSDVGAAFQFGKMKPIECHTFVDMSYGPYQVHRFGNEAIQFQSDITTALSEWEEHRQSNVTSSHNEMVTAKAQNQQLDKLGREEGLKRARESSAAKMSERKQRTSIVFKADQKDKEKSSCQFGFQC